MEKGMHNMVLGVIMMLIITSCSSKELNKIHVESADVSMAELVGDTGVTRQIFGSNLYSSRHYLYNSMDTRLDVAKYKKAHSDDLVYKGIVLRGNIKGYQLIVLSDNPSPDPKFFKEVK